MDYVFSGCISLVVAIIVYIISFCINDQKRKEIKSDELSQYKKFIEEWVDKSNSTLTKYIDSLRKFSNEIKVNTDLNIAMWKSSLIHLTRIDNISLERYADIFMYGLDESDENENRKRLMNFLYQIEYINKAEKLIMKVYEEYTEENRRIMDEWNVYNGQLVHLVTNTTTHTDTFEKIKFEEIFKRFAVLLRNDGTFAGTDKWKSEFVDPSIVLLSDEKCDKYPLLVQLIDLISSLNFVILKHNKLNDYSDIFKEYIESLTNAQKIINDSLDYFKSHTLKQYCN